MRSILSNHHYTMRVISAFVLPLVIYGLDTFGGVYRLPFFVVGALVLLKALIDLKSIHRPTQRKRKRVSRLYCYLCKQEATNLNPYHVPGKRMAVCDRCYACIQFTDRYA